jgi:hypothetical protein
MVVIASGNVTTGTHRVAAFRLAGGAVPAAPTFTMFMQFMVFFVCDAIEPD